MNYSDEWTPEMVDTIYEASRGLLDQQINIMMNMRRRAETIAGWLIGAIVALSAVLANNLIPGTRDDRVITVTVIGLAVLVASEAMLFLGILVKRDIYPAVGKVSTMLRDSVRKCLLDRPYEKRNILSKWFWAKDMEYSYEQNNIQLKRDILWYRISVATLFIGGTVTIVLTIILL